MTDEQIMKLFDANEISPNLQRTRDSEKEPVYFAGGYAGSLADLQELNEAEPIGKQLGGRRTRNRRVKGRRTRNRKAKSRQRRSTYRRRLSLQRRSTYRRR
jgi:hypothetical protein